MAFNRSYALLKSIKTTYVDGPYFLLAILVTKLFSYMTLVITIPTVLVSFVYQSVIRVYLNDLYFSDLHENEFGYHYIYHSFRAIL